MRKDYFGKGMVLGIIVLFFGASFIPISYADVIIGLDPDAPPLLPPGAPPNCGYEDFESGIDGDEIISTIPGLKFTTTGGYDWVYADVRTGNYNAKYPNGAYTCQGNICAWLGPEQSYGRIDFIKGDASYFSCYVSTYSGAVVDAYKDDGTFICSSGWASNNLNTGEMTLLSVSSPNPDIGYVIIHDTGNYWVIDRVVCDATGVGTNQHPVVKVVIESIYQGNNRYNVNVKLKNIGEESLDAPSNTHGIHVQIIGGEIQNTNKGTFENCQEYYGSGVSEYEAMEFYVQYLDHNDEYSGSFSFIANQEDLAVIGIRGWIFDKDNNDYILNPNTGQNEPYIARCPLEDLSSYNNRPYNQHMNDDDFSILEYKLNYYPMYQNNDYNINSHSTWIGLGWSYGQSTSAINTLLDKLKTQSIHEIYLNIGSADSNGNYSHGGNPLLTKKQVKLNCKDFMDTVNQYATDNSYNFEVYSWTSGGPGEYNVNIESVRTNIVQFCQEFIGSKVGFDGIHFDYEFWDTAYNVGYQTLLEDIDDEIGEGKLLSVDICSSWLHSPWSNYVYDIADIADEIILMAYDSGDLGGEYISYMEWVEDETDEILTQASSTDADVIIGISCSNAITTTHRVGERLDYGLVGTILGAYKNGKSQVYLSIWNNHQADITGNWDTFESIWNPVRNFDVYIFSPVDLHIYDSLGRHVGVNYTTGLVENEIPGAYYSGPDAEPQRISIQNPEGDRYTIILVGTDDGAYQMKIEGFIADTLIHSEIIDGVAIIGESQSFNVIIPQDNPFYLIVTDNLISSTIDIDPNTLNKNSSGKWITSYIELPEGYDVADIDSILLNNVVPAEDHPTEIDDYDNDGIPDLMVKFDRQDVIDIIESGDDVEIKVTGELIDGTRFEGTDYIKVI